MTKGRDIGAKYESNYENLARKEKKFCKKLCFNLGRRTCLYLPRQIRGTLSKVLVGYRPHHSIRTMLVLVIHTKSRPREWRETSSSSISLSASISTSLASRDKLVVGVLDNSSAKLPGFSSFILSRVELRNEPFLEVFLGDLPSKLESLTEVTPSWLISISESSLSEASCDA